MAAEGGMKESERRLNEAERGGWKGELEELSESGRGSSRSRVLLGSVVWRAAALKAALKGDGVCVALISPYDGC